MSRPSTRNAYISDQNADPAQPVPTTHKASLKQILGSRVTPIPAPTTLVKQVLTLPLKHISIKVAARLVACWRQQSAFNILYPPIRRLSQSKSRNGYEKRRI